MDRVLALSGRCVSNVSFCFMQQARMSNVLCKGQADTDFRCKKLTVVQLARDVGSLVPRTLNMLRLTHCGMFKGQLIL